MMFGAIYIPSKTDEFTILNDWTVVLEWERRNLTILRAFKVTGMVKDPDTGRRRTIRSKLFMDLEGNYTPVTVTMLAGTRIAVGQCHSARRGKLGLINLKVVESPRTGLKGCPFQVPLEDLSGLAVELH